MSEFGAPSKWMWLPANHIPCNDRAYIALFRRTFTLRYVRPCTLRISADSRYKLYVNGDLVDVGPCKGDDKLHYYDAIDITSRLAEGENIVAVEVLRYPNRHGAGNHSIFRSEYPGLYIEETLHGDLEPIDQTWTSLQSDAKEPARDGRLGLTASADWHCRLLEGFEIVPENAGFAPLQIYEKCAGVSAFAGWKRADYREDAAWIPVHVYNALEISRAVSPGNLFPRPIPFMQRESCRFSSIKVLRESSVSEAEWNRFLAGQQAITLPPNSKTVVEIDAGEEMCGYPTLRLIGGSAAEIEILYAEAYASVVNIAPDGQCYPVKTDRCDSEHGELSGNADHYTVAGYGQDGFSETYTPFWFRTFRFIRLTLCTADAPLTLVDYNYEATGYPLAVKSHVETSDPSYAPIWDISLRTLRRCMHETYMDCPFYEQLQYAMDARSEILYTYAVSMDDHLARQCMDDFRRAQRHDGLLNGSYPNCEPNVIPGFSIYYILMLYDHMMYFGDRAFLQEHLPCVDGILSAFRRKLTPEGLVGSMGGVLADARYWSFVDWTAQWDATSGVPDATLRGPIAMESFLYILGLMAASRINRWLDRESTAREYDESANALRAALRRYCRDERGMFTDGPGASGISQHCQVFAVLTETVSAEEGRECLLPTLEEPEKYVQCSVAMMYYLFRAMEKTGLYDYTDEKWDIWRNMVKMNLSTCVEDGVTGRSDCHAWGSLALYEWPSVTLGVRPATPGYEAVRIHPIPGKLDRASGEVVTKNGVVRVEWTKNRDGSLALNYDAPEGVAIIE